MIEPIIPSERVHVSTDGEIFTDKEWKQLKALFPRCLKKCRDCVHRNGYVCSKTRQSCLYVKECQYYQKRAEKR